jgi:ribosomal protein S18 acetylase RimI-like enzyme
MRRKLEQVLDNPIWHSLNSRHAHLALTCGEAKRYPPEVAPFVGVPSVAAEPHLDKLISPGERVGILNIIPPLESWTVIKDLDLYQYIWSGQAQAKPDEQAVKLTEAHLPAMLELTALVYPAYFRPGTARLGDYVGLFDGGRLAAMAGIRMSMHGHQELSAICTHPDYRGRGYAKRLTLHLVDQILKQGDLPFLHTEADNLAGQKVYEAVGFEVRAALPFKVLERP